MPNLSSDDKIPQSDVILYQSIVGLISFPHHTEDSWYLSRSCVVVYIVCVCDSCLSSMSLCVNNGYLTEGEAIWKPYYTRTFAT